MPQKRKLVTQIRRDSRGRGISSSAFINPTSNPLRFCPLNNQKHPQKPIQTQSQPNSQTTPAGQAQAQVHNHLQIQIQVPPTSPPPPPPPPRQATHQSPPHSFHDDQPGCNNPSKTTQKGPLFSTPHKRPVIMIQSPPSSLSHSPTLSSLHSLRRSNFSAKPPNLNDTVSFGPPFSSKTLAHKLLSHLRHARLLCVHLRVLVLVFLPSLYFFLFNPRRLLVFGLLSFLSFSITLIIFPNFALPRFPSIRLFLARSLPLKITQPPRISTKDSKPVIWSIGSKPKLEKKPISGSWVQVYSNGDVYEGEFHKGKCSGSGVYYYNMRGRYEGDWVDGKYDGYGVETWAKGSRYRGQYSQGLRHGIGVYRFYTGDVYSGEWSNGQCHGCGIHTCEDGSKYVGEFKWGVKHGLGHYHFRNGDTYAGEYFADSMHGFGVYKFGNGHLYEGAWHEGRRQGLGMYTFRSGETQSGHWQNGFLEVASKENSNPGSSNAISHVRVLNAVQEAQRAAEKAYNVAKVEERVNKAVAAANRAANAARVAAVKAVQKRMYHNNDGDMPPLSIQR